MSPDDSSRIQAFRAMLERNPGDPRAHFGLAAEYEKLGRWDDAVRELRAYLSIANDEGNAWGRLGHALRQLGQDAEAQEAYRRGVKEAASHGHPTMAADFEEILQEWD